MKDTTKVIIQHHSYKYTDSDCHMHDIVRVPDMPREMSISCEFLEFVAIRNSHLLIIIKEMPGRIDYDKYLGTLHILSQEESRYCHKPYSVIDKGMSATLWELGEREQMDIEEIGGVLPAYQ